MLSGNRIKIREYAGKDLNAMTVIWNKVVEDGMAFPQTEELSEIDAASFFAGQTFTGVAESVDTGELQGLYILHPNNVGRCGHIANASYAVKPSARGTHIGEQLVIHSLENGKRLGFALMQFNAVVNSNLHAIHLYERLGFVRLGTIPGGFLLKSGIYEDIILFYRKL